MTSVSKNSPKTLQNDEVEVPKKIYFQKKGNKLLMN